MNPQEILAAAAGSRISNRPVSDIEEIVIQVANRLGIPPRHQPKGDALRYMAQQIFQRHTYTLDEMMLAVDLYNGGELSCTVSITAPFSLQTINSLMHSYREVKARCNMGETLRQDNTEDMESLNLQARKDTCRQIYEAMRRGDDPGIVVMYLWMMAYRHLLSEGGVTEEQFTGYELQAVKAFRSSEVASGRTSDLLRNFKVGTNVANFQAMFVVKDYMYAKIKNQ